jgi:hypothetical protein
MSPRSLQLTVSAVVLINDNADSIRGLIYVGHGKAIFLFCYNSTAILPL